MFDHNIWKICVFIILLNFCYTDEGPAIISISSNIIHDIGDTLELECQVENIENNFVIWTKIIKWEERIPITVGSQLVYPDTRFTFTIDNETQTYRLKIERLEPNDSAMYECHINVVGGSSDRNKQQVDVSIRQPPQITYKTTNSTTLELGNSDELFCSANGFPKPQITWRRHNNKILPFGGHTHHGIVLQLQNVTKHDRGMYICEAVNGVGAPDRKLIEVKVIFPPHVSTKWPKMGQAMGKSIKLLCIAEGFPTVILDWKRNGEILGNDNNYVREFNGYYDDIVQSTLTIRSLKETQYGDYYCEASNVLGVVSKRIHIFRRTDDGPSIIGISRNKVLNIGGTLELECQVENSENFLVIWTKIKKQDQRIPITVGNRLVYPDPRFNLTINNKTQTYKIKIENLEPNDSAKYECKINVVGGGTERNKQSVDVIIQEPPQITLKTTNWTTLELGNSENLLCVANGVPKPQIKWHREDGKMLPFGGHTHDGNSLRLQNVTNDDRGIYICEADNGVGSPDRRLIQVKVIFPPHVTTEFPKMGQALRYSVKLSCTAEGFPYVVFDWKHNGVILRDDDNYSREFNYYLSDTRHTNLTIRSLKETQYGDYYCEASNILGVVAKRIHVFQTKTPVNYK